MDNGIKIRNRAAITLHNHMPPNAKDARQKLMPESVHYRHHDDQHGDADRDSQQRNDRDDRDEAFLSFCTEITERQHPFEQRESASAPLAAGPGGSFS